jgi:hypothetical protein
MKVIYYFYRTYIKVGNKKRKENNQIYHTLYQLLMVLAVFVLKAM